MREIVEKVKRAAEMMKVADWNNWMPDPIVVEARAISQVAGFVQNKGYTSIVLIADTNTFEAAGKRVAADLEAAGLPVNITMIKPDRQGDVLADEVSIVQALLDIQRTEADLIIAVGSGTLHDIARYAAYTVHLPFLSVPTAASVDGFTSKGAPIIIRGEKITVAAVGPVAIFADLDILKAAPKALTAAGFGDMLGKYTSLLDWEFGRITANEPYAGPVADMTLQALEACVQQAENIGHGTEEGIRTLIIALIESGLAMLLFGQSHSASGAEHHLSHYWEMEFIRTGRRQLLHGAKVGVACAEISALYHRIAVDERLAKLPEWKVICERIAKLPDEDRIRGLLRTVGGPSTVEELGIEQELVERSLLNAHQVRLNRHTLLRAYNEAINYEK